LNASDPSQVNQAEHNERLVEEVRLAALKSILETKQGRDVMWWFLEEASVFKSIWSQSAMIHYSAGKQDFGHFIQGNILKVDANAYMQMMLDAQKENSGETNV
jgi:hypothetical protein